MNKLILLIPLILLIIPFVVSKPEPGVYIVPIQTFDSTGEAQKNWTLTSNARITDGNLEQQGISDLSDPNRYVHNITQDFYGAPGNFTCNWMMNMSVTATGASLRALNWNQTGNIDGSQNIWHINDPAAGPLKDFRNNDGSSKIDDVPIGGGHWNNISIVFNSSDDKMFFYINSTLFGEITEQDPNEYWGYFTTHTQGTSFWIDNFSCWYGDQDASRGAPPPPDTTPPDLRHINLTSEGGLGQIIFEDGGVDNRLTNIVRTNDTTPTITLNTTEDSTCAFVDPPLVIDVKTTLNDGSKVTRKSDRNIIIEKADTIFNVTSDIKIWELGDITKTREWEYKEKGQHFEIIESNKDLVVMGDYVCSTEDFEVIDGKQGILVRPDSKKFTNCIYYPKQLVDKFIEVDLIDEDTNKVIGRTNKVIKENKRSISLIEDKKVRIDFLDEYDPEITTFVNNSEVQIKNTADTVGFTEIAKIKGSDLTANRKYLLYASYGISGNETSGRCDIRLTGDPHNWEFSGIVEPVGSINDVKQQVFMRNYTTNATPGDIVMDFKSNTATVNCTSLNAQLFLLDLSGLTEGTHYYYQENNTFEGTTGTLLRAYASVTLDEADSLKDWLIMGSVFWDVDETSNDGRMDLFDETNSQAFMNITVEGESSSEELTYTNVRTFNDVADNTKFSVRFAPSTSQAADHISSAIFALDLSQFESHDSRYFDGTIILTSTLAPFANLSYRPTTEGNQIILANWMPTVTSSSAGWVDDLQVNGTTEPPNWLWANDYVVAKTPHDAGDKIPNNMLGFISLSGNGNSTITLRGDDTGSGDVTIQEYSITAFSVELVSAEEPAEPTKNDNYSNIILGGIATECETTGTLFHVCTLPAVNVTTIGLNSYVIGCKDTTGNENSTSTSSIFNINITDGEPAAVFIGANSGQLFEEDINNTDMVFNWSATDNFDRNFTVTVDVNGSEIYTNSTFFNASDGKILFTRAEGIYNLSLTTTDSFNNINTTDYAVTVAPTAADTTEPIANINITVGDFFVNDINNTFVLVANATDDINSTFKFEGFVNETTIFSQAEYANGTSVATTQSRGVGNFNFSVNATDDAGNSGQASFLFEVRNDTIPPTADINGTMPTFFVNDINNTFTLNANATDNFNTTFVFQGYINESSIFSEDPYANGTTISTTVGRGPGIYNFSVNASDGYGNVNKSSFAFEVQNDSVKPIVSINTSIGAFFLKDFNNTFFLSVNATDNFNSTLFLFEGFINNSRIFSNSSYLNGTTVSNLTTKGVGVFNYSVNATDLYGNLQESSFIFVVEELNIVFTLNQHPNDTLIYQDTNIQFNFTIDFTDDLGSCFLIINDTINRTNSSLIIDNTKHILNGTNLTINRDYLWGVGCNLTNGAEVNSTDRNLLYVYSPINISFSLPTPANNSQINNLSILINVSTQGRVLNYTLEWNGVNESVTFNETLNLLINKTGLEDLTLYNFTVYVNDTNGRLNNTEYRIININLFGLEVGITGGVDFFFRPVVGKAESFNGNDSLNWLGNNSGILLSNLQVSRNFTFYNNGTIVKQGNNWTITTTGIFTFLNSTTLFNGSGELLVTDKLNFSYSYFNGESTISSRNISCNGQNDSLGCLNFSTTAASLDLNLSLIFNITNDPVRSRIIEDFSLEAFNWTVGLLRSNNTNNRTQANHSVICTEIQSRNQTGLIQYRFNNSIELSYLNQTNSSQRLNFTFNCSSVLSVQRIFNGTQKNISGFDTFNFSYIGDNTSNTFVINLIDDGGTKTVSPSFSLKNSVFNFTGFSLGSIGNISIINISITNVSSTLGLNNFVIDTLRLTNSTHNQSQYITTYASCTNSFGNATVLAPNVLTQICIVPKGKVNKFVWLWQDILNPFRGLRWLISYNVTQVN